MAAETLAIPFIALFILLIVVLVILTLAFWIWMIVDCVQRKFKNDTEKIVWIIIIVLAQLLGAIVYYFAVKLSNPRGLSK